jgi:NDP-sugar pyrophosphorylase family protein
MYQIVIIAGGLGSRLGKLTQKVPKALIKIDKKPFIYYQLNQLSKQGFKKVVICVGYLGDKIKKYVGSGKKFNLNIKYSHENKKLLGTAGCIRKAIPLLEDNFFVTYGDTYLPVNFKNIQKSFEKQNAKALITVYKNYNKLASSNVCFKGKNIFYQKNSKSKKMNFIEYGVSIFSKEIFIESKFKNLSDLSDMLSFLSKIKKLKHHVVKKRFYEIGSNAGLKETKNYLKYSIQKL